MNELRIDVVTGLEEGKERLFAAHRIIFVTVAFLFFSYVMISSNDAQASQKAAVYGISAQKFTASNQNTGRGATLVEKCVFYPLQKDIYRKKALAKETVSTLQNLRDYAVFDARGKKLNTKFQKFEYLIDDFPNYYAGSIKPTAGCGSILVAGKVLRDHVREPENLATLKKALLSMEQKLFASLLKQPPEWVDDETKKDLSKHDLAKTFKKSSKSAIEVFYDGQDWYFTRSYFVEFVVPTTLSALILYKANRTGESVSSILAYVNTQRGEGMRSLRYAGFWDLDGDGMNEIIVHDFGLEWQGFSYLRWAGDRWRLSKED